MEYILTLYHVIYNISLSIIRTVTCIARQRRDKYLVRNPNIKVRAPEYGLRIMYLIELWALDEAWKETAKVPNRFCEKLLGLLTRAANCMAEIELGRDSRRGEEDVRGSKILAKNCMYGYSGACKTRL
jgi:hypothetical protein